MVTFVADKHSEPSYPYGVRFDKDVILFNEATLKLVSSKEEL